MHLLSQESRYRKIVLKDPSRKIGVFLFNKMNIELEQLVFKSSCLNLLADKGYYDPTTRIFSFPPHEDGHVLRIRYLIARGILKVASADEYEAVLLKLQLEDTDLETPKPWTFQ